MLVWMALTLGFQQTKFYNWMAAIDGVECCRLGIDAWM